MKNQLWCYAGSALLLCSCALDTPPEDGPTFEEILSTATRLDDGRLVIDEDILVGSEAEARAYYDREMRWSAAMRRAHDQGDVGRRSDELTLATIDGERSTWSFPERMQLTYCVDAGGFGSNAPTLIDALDRAAQDWSRIVAVRFERVDVTPCNNTTSAVVFNVRAVSSRRFRASAFFPGHPRADRELLVAPGAFAPSIDGADLLGIMRHELGHALGFRHEHIWLPWGCTPESVNVAVPGLGTLGAEQLTPYDVDSVMHYLSCRPSGSGEYRISPEDYRGAVALYGLAPALVLATL